MGDREREAISVSQFRGRASISHRPRQGAKRSSWFVEELRKEGSKGKAGNWRNGMSREEREKLSGTFFEGECESQITWHLNLRREHMKLPHNLMSFADICMPNPVVYCVFRAEEYSNFLKNERRNLQMICGMPGYSHIFFRNRPSPFFTSRCEMYLEIVSRCNAEELDSLLTC